MPASSSTDSVSPKSRCGKTVNDTSIDEDAISQVVTISSVSKVETIAASEGYLSNIALEPVFLLSTNTSNYKVYTLANPNKEIVLSLVSYPMSAFMLLQKHLSCLLPQNPNLWIPPLPSSGTRKSLTLQKCHQLLTETASTKLSAMEN